MQDIRKHIVDFFRDMGVILGGIGLLIATSVKIVKPLQQILKKVDINTNIVGILMRERIMEKYDTYTAPNRNYATAKEKKEFDELVQKYWKLGFNHFSEQMLEDVMDLPNHP